MHGFLKFIICVCRLPQAPKILPWLVILMMLYVVSQFLPIFRVLVSLIGS